MTKYDFESHTSKSFTFPYYYADFQNQYFYFQKQY